MQTASQAMAASFPAILVIALVAALLALAIPMLIERHAH